MKKMKIDAWMPLYIGDYARDTLHLCREEHGSYLLLIMAYWANGGPLKDDDRSLKAITKCPDHEWARTRGLLSDFFTVKDGYWRHKRIDSELDDARANMEARRHRTEAATRARLERDDQRNVERNEKRNVVPDQNVTTTPSPSPSPVPSTVTGSNDDEHGAGEPGKPEGEPKAEPKQPESRECEWPEVPSWEAWEAKCKVLGLPDWRIKSTWTHWEKVYWKDRHGRPVKWQAAADQCFSYWMREGSPVEPPKLKTGEVARANGASLIVLNDELRRLDTDAKKLELERDQWGALPEQARRKMTEVNARRREIRKELGLK